MSKRFCLNIGLHPEMETESYNGENPVQKYRQYSENCRGQSDSKSASEAGLPIGSAEMKSAQNCVVQKRLSLGTLRENG